MSNLPYKSPKIPNLQGIRISADDIPHALQLLVGGLIRED